MGTVGTIDNKGVTGKSLSRERRYRRASSEGGETWE